MIRSADKNKHKVNTPKNGVLTNTEENKEYPLDELVQGITPENCHGEIDFGPPIGKELI